MTETDQVSVSDFQEQRSVAPNCKFSLPPGQDAVLSITSDIIDGDVFITLNGKFSSMSSGTALPYTALPAKCSSGSQITSTEIILLPQGTTIASVPRALTVIVYSYQSTLSAQCWSVINHHRPSLMILSLLISHRSKRKHYWIFWQCMKSFLTPSPPLSGKHQQPPPEEKQIVCPSFAAAHIASHQRNKKSFKHKSITCSKTR